MEKTYSISYESLYEDIEGSFLTFLVAITITWPFLLMLLK